MNGWLIHPNHLKEKNINYANSCYTQLIFKLDSANWNLVKDNFLDLEYENQNKHLSKKKTFHRYILNMKTISPQFRYVFLCYLSPAWISTPLFAWAVFTDIFFISVVTPNVIKDFNIIFVQLIKKVSPSKNISFFLQCSDLIFDVCL